MVDSLVSSRSSQAMKELSAKVAELERSLGERDADLVQGRAAECELQQTNESLTRRLSEAESRIMTLDQSYKASMSKASDEADHRKELSKRLADTNSLLQESQSLHGELAAKLEEAEGELSRRSKRYLDMEEELGHAKRELDTEKASNESLKRSLAEASNTIAKRGDDFSESVRLLQGRIEATEGELKQTQEGLRQTLEDNSRLQTINDKLNIQLKSAGGSGEREAQAQGLLREAEQRLKAAGDVHASLDEACRSAQEELKKARESVVAGEMEREELLKDMQAIARERDEAMVLLGGEGGGDMGRRVLQAEKEVATMEEELDKVLAENAQLREELDEEREKFSSIGASLSTQQTMQHSSSTAESAPMTPMWSKAPEIHVPHMDGLRRGVTLGVHTLRLLKNSFVAWMWATVDSRMSGKRTGFAGMEHFCAPDGAIAPWFPAGRLRRGDLEVWDEKLGTGTFAEVFRGEWRIPVAVKRMRASPKIGGGSNKKELHEFVREGEMCRTLSHPSIVRLIGVYSDGIVFSLVHELCNGDNMFDYLHKFNQTVPFGKQLSLALQVCEALAYVHSHGIVHRDVKPQNLIYSETSGNIKVGQADVELPVHLCLRRKREICWG
jgi:uncharacterized membrane protein